MCPAAQPHTLRTTNTTITSTTRTSAIFLAGDETHRSIGNGHYHHQHHRDVTKPTTALATAKYSCTQVGNTVICAVAARVNDDAAPPPPPPRQQEEQSQQRGACLPPLDSVVGARHGIVDARSCATVTRDERDCVQCRRLPRQGIFVSTFEVPAPLAGDTRWMSAEAQRILALPNAGGHSALSEALSVQYFVDAFGGRNVRAEMEIGYWFDYKMADFLVQVDTHDDVRYDAATGARSTLGPLVTERIGVSVTRAMAFPDPRRFRFADAVALLRKKLYGLVVARNAVCEEDSFHTAYLHIWCQTVRIARLVRHAFRMLATLDDPRNEFALTTNIIAGCTVCGDAALYANGKQLRRLRADCASQCEQQH